MPDKRTAELQTIDVTVALLNGLLVVDTVALESADDEQQKVLIKTLLDTYALAGNNYAVGNLNITKIPTTDVNTTEVLLADSSGKVVVRDISALLGATEAVKTGITIVEDEASESITGSANDQKDINQQNVGEFGTINDKIDNITELGATGTITASPVPQAMTTLTQVFTFAQLFESTNPNVLEIDAINNEIILKATGVYELDWFLNISNDEVALSRLATVQIRNKDTLDIIDDEELFIPDAGFSGNWVTRFSVTNAPVTIELVQFCDKDNELNILMSIASISSIKSAGIPEVTNPYFIDIIGEDDPITDRNHIIQALADAQEGYIIRLFGTFNLQDEIILDQLSNLTIDYSAAFIKAIRSDADPKVFNIKNCSDIRFLNPYGTLEHTSSTSQYDLFYIDNLVAACNNLTFENIFFELAAGTILNRFYLVNDEDNSNFTRINGGRSSVSNAWVQVGTNAIVQDLYLSGTSSVVYAWYACLILKNKAYSIEVIGTQNIVTNNNASLYFVDPQDNIYFNNWGQTINFLQASDDANITGDWVFETTLKADVQNASLPAAEFTNTNYSGNVLDLIARGSVNGHILHLHNNTLSEDVFTVNKRGWLKIGGHNITQTGLLEIYNGANVYFKIEELGSGFINGFFKVNSNSVATEALDVNGNIVINKNVAANTDIGKVYGMSNTAMPAIRFRRGAFSHVGEILLVGTNSGTDYTGLKISEFGRVAIMPINDDYQPTEALDVNGSIVVSGNNNSIRAAFDGTDVNTKAALFSNNLGSGIILADISNNIIMRLATFGDSYYNRSISINKSTTPTEALDVNGLGKFLGSINGVTPTTETILIGKEGVLGNRSSLFLYNTGGSIRMGISGVINSANKLTINNTGVAINKGEILATEALDVNGRLKFSNTSEPTTPASGGVLYTELSVLKYKNSSGNVYNLLSGGSTSKLMYNGLITDAGNKIMSFGDVNPTITKGGTGTYTLTHNLNNINVSVQLSGFKSSITSSTNFLISSRTADAIVINTYEGTSLTDLTFYVTLHWQ